MKFKKAFAWILAVAMVITLMPSMAFATSTNTVRGITTVGTNTTLSAIEMNVEVRDNDWDDVGGSAMKPQHIKLNLTNVEVDGTIVKDGNLSAGAAATNQITLSNQGTLEVTVSPTSPAKTVNFQPGSVIVSDNSIEFTLISSNSLIKSDILKFVFSDGVLKSGSESGPAEISIDSIDSDITASGGLTVATVGSGGTVASVTGSAKTYGRISEVEMDTTIELREAVVGAVRGSQLIRLTLPKGMSWDKLNVAGSLFTNSPAAGFSFNGSATINDDYSNWTSAANGAYVLKNDGRTLYIKLNETGDRSNRRVALLKPTISIDRTAAEGEITVDIYSQAVASNGNAISEASDLVIGHYGSESVKVSTVEDDKLPVIYSGYEKTNKDKYTWLQLTIEETVRDSLSEGRYIDVELPEAVQVLKDVGIKATLDKNPVLADAGKSSTYSKISDGLMAYGSKETYKDQSSFTLEVPSASKSSVGKDTWSDEKANKLTLFIPVTIRADFTGDIEATVKGGRAGVDDTTIVLGKAESPITVTAKTTEVRNGVQSQALADITITENVAGYLDADNDNNRVTLNIDTLKLSGTSITDAKVEVTDGDLVIKNVKKGTTGLTFEIDEESTKPSTISITGVVGALNRTLPEGPYALQVYGSALVQNGRYNDGDFADPSGVPKDDTNNLAAVDGGDVCAAKVADYVKIVTPADPSTITNKINAVFTLRQDTFTNNGETVQMDTAPYLDANNRTQLPIRYAAIACGVPESDISWNQATQTATINGQNVVLRITIGSNIMQTSAGNVTMDTAAVSSNGRIFVPIRYIANALGADVAWDQDAKTITLTN